MLKRIFSCLPKGVYQLPRQFELEYGEHLYKKQQESKFFVRSNKEWDKNHKYLYKNKKYEFKKKILGDFYLWCSGVLGVSSVLIAHKWLNKSCPYKKLDSVLTENILKDYTIQAVGPGPIIGKPASEQHDEECREQREAAIGIQNDEEETSWINAKWRFFQTVSKCTGSMYNKLALQSAARNDIQQAFQYFLKASEYGHTGSLYNIGLCYELGKGVKQSYNKAAKFYKEAADLGEAKAMYNLSTIYSDYLLENSDANEGFKYLKLAADHGLVKAQRVLGLKYAEQHKWKSAVKYFHMAALQKDAVALYNLGICYTKGNGVTVNDRQAMTYFLKAAELGHTKAQYTLGYCFESGLKGCGKDISVALKWYRRAGESGNTDALQQVEILEYELKQKSEELLLTALDLNPTSRILNPILKTQEFQRSASAPSLRGLLAPSEDQQELINMTTCDKAVW